jgi:ATP-dependent helicase HrpB
MSTAKPKRGLPIDAILPEVLDGLRAAGAVVLKADPGAGKTTRVPPAILDAGLAKSADGKPAQIVVLQPRRIAARAAAARISDERGTKLGAEVGYQVRHECCASAQTRILICTEGVFLRRLQSDPLLENVGALVFDEFHERSIDSDLALALARQVRDQVRPDLQLIVMSATLKGEPIAQYLGGCPVIESPGRTYPVDINYLQFEPTAQLVELVADGIEKSLPTTGGHVLAFLPGVGEIRRVEELLDRENVFCLYGDMDLDEQQRVLSPSDQRKIILATNVAETSVTIDGVTCVVDGGMARVNRFDAQLGLNRLELQRISRAAADQRAGRAGRTGPGRCLRLWTERQHKSLSDFESPEIMRVELSETLLQIFAWGERDVQQFPWFEPPPATSIELAMQLLHLLGALHNDTLTEVGKQMARLPLQPRLARLILNCAHRGYLERGALCAALLAERDPFRKKEKDFKPDYHYDSDVVERLAAIEAFAATGTRDHSIGQLSPPAAKQILRAARQLQGLVSSDLGKTEPRVGNAPEEKADEAVMKAVAAAFPDRVCKRRQPNDRRAVMVGGRGVCLSTESGVADSDLFIAVEISDSKQSESLVRQASHVRREWLPASNVITSTDVFYNVERKKVIAVRRVKYCDLVLEEAQTQLPPDIDAGTLLAEGILANVDLAALIDDSAQRYMLRLNFLRESVPELNLPDLGSWAQLLPDWCQGCTGVEDLRADVLIGCIQARLTPPQAMALDADAPERIVLPNGRSFKLDYTQGKTPVLAARIQELFGLTETPRIARGRVPVLLHLLAPNYRVQQITPDLASFWKNTYPEVRKELRSRYPKHAWPENPLVVQPNVR